MNITCKSRCGNCGAEIQAQHLGKYQYGDGDVPVGYCERCNEFTFTIGEDEKPYRERMAEAKLRIPKGWSRRQCEDGSIELKRDVPRRWLWAFPVGFTVIVYCAWVAVNYTYLCDKNVEWPVYPASFGLIAVVTVWLFALYRLTARRYRLDREALVVESLWLGFIPMCRRRFARTVITSGCIEEQGKSHVAVWSNGYDRHKFWRGRSKDEAEFIEANLLSPSASKLSEEPLLCGKCGSEFRPEDIDMPYNSLICSRCGAVTGPDDAGYARLVRFRMRYRPQGVVDVPGGVELRERRWWSGSLRAALSRYVSVALIIASFAKLFEKIPAPWVYIPMSILLMLLAAAPVYFIASVIVGRFGVHRITARGGRLFYFHGIGRFGRRVELPLDAIGDVGVICRSSLINGIAATIPNALGIVVKGEKGVRRIFRDCPPISYHWVKGWLRETLKSSMEEAK